MKVTVAVFNALALLGAVSAQGGDFDSLPQCGKDCVNGLLDKATSFGCSADASNEANCLCSNVTFSYGFRDCSNEHCLNSDGSTDPAAASSVVAYGIAYCSSAGVAIPTTVETVSSATGGPTGSATGTGGAGASGSAVGTTSVLATLTTDGSTLTTSVASTIFSSADSSLSSLSSSVSGEASSISASASSALSSLSSAGSGAASSATGTAGSATSSGFAPQMTAGPAGFLAAAGLAAMLL